MEMKKAWLTRLSAGAVLASLLAACAAADMRQAQITDVYVADFKSDDVQSCRPSDVPLDHARARDFFRRARQVAYAVIHDHYDIAPCYVEGTLKYRANACEWKIRAGATAQIQCGEKTRYFVCDGCEDLFKEP